MEVVGDGRADGCGQSGYPVARLLNTRSGRNPLPYGSAEQAADIGLTRRVLEKVEVAIARHQMPLLAEIVVNAPGVVIGDLRNSHVEQIALRVVTVSRLKVVRGRHEFPDLAHDRIQTNPSRIARAGRAGCRLISLAIQRNRKGIQIVGLVDAG